MNRLYLFCGFLLCLLLQSPIQAQVRSGTVTYQVKADKEKFDKRYEDVDNKGFWQYWFSNIQKGLPYIKYDLVFNANEATFQMEELGMDNDNGVDMEFATTFAGGKGLFYFNIEEDQTLLKEHKFGDDIIVYQKLSDLNWQITDETKKIQGYLCYKAIADPLNRNLFGKKTVAWFAPKLPFQFGPMIFGGLPGLVLELENDIYIYYATDLKLSHKDKAIQKLTEGGLISTEEFLERSHQQLKKNKARAKE